MERMTKDMTTYDYMEICAAEAKVSFLTDCCQCFGWRTDENVPAVYQQGKIRIRLKRDRKLVNKAELTRLQRNFESCAEEIEKMEKSINSTAQMAALTLGVIGTVFMALSVFAVTATPPHIVLTVLYAIPAFAGWISPYFVYRKVRAYQKEKLEPLIEQKWEEIDTLCEKGSRLTGIDR